MKFFRDDHRYNLLYPYVGRQAEHFPEKLIWDINEQEENFWCLLISFQL